MELYFKKKSRRNRIIHSNSFKVQKVKDVDRKKTGERIFHFVDGCNN